MKIIWLNPAIKSLREILEYISQDSPKAGEKYCNDIYTRVNSLLKFPEAGMVYHLNGKRVVRKIIIAKTKSIFYRVQQDKIYILAIRDNRQASK
jgi:toxin ParE1/3/4